MSGRLCETGTQLIQGDDGGLGVAVEHVEDACLTGLAIQGHLKHVEGDLLKSGRASIDGGER